MSESKWADELAPREGIEKFMREFNSSWPADVARASQEKYMAKARQRHERLKQTGDWDAYYREFFEEIAGDAKQVDADE